MKRKMILLILSLALLLTACGGETPPVNGSAPGRMVRKIEVSIHPEDPAFARTYVTQENMNELLGLLRSLENSDEPDREPVTDDGQNLYTATVTFANGQQSVYYLLGHTYLRLGDKPWCTITLEQSKRFTDFIRTHPSDDGSAETTIPPETTQPAE